MNFGYSIFYVYYEQYLSIWRDTIFSVTISLATIFVVSFILTGFDLIAATVIVMLVSLILINMGGMMWFVIFIDQIEILQCNSYVILIMFFFFFSPFSIKLQ